MRHHNNNVGNSSEICILWSDETQQHCRKHRLEMYVLRSGETRNTIVRNTAQKTCILWSGETHNNTVGNSWETYIHWSGETILCALACWGRMIPEQTPQFLCMPGVKVSIWMSHSCFSNTIVCIIKCPLLDMEPDECPGLPHRIAPFCLPPPTCHTQRKPAVMDTLRMETIVHIGCIQANENN